MHFVIIPGINGSDEDHWQSIWQAEWGSAASRIAPASWDEPDVDDWCRALDRAVTDARSARVVLVAHSLGCVAATEWVARARPDVSGVFLVAPPDTAGPGFPAEASGFAALTATPLSVPGLLVTSENDPYCTTDAADRLAEAWRVDHINAGPTGHVNSASGLGRWGFGRALLTAFAAGR
jgi:predicted alpha/beta hydrolase family esterase